MRWVRVLFVTVFVAALLAGLAAVVGRWRIGRAPHVAHTLTPGTTPAPLETGAVDVLGRLVAAEEVRRLRSTPEGRATLAPERGAVEITDELVELGRRAFYEQTYGNEVFLTEVVGILDGPIGVPAIARAVAKLGGRPTANLRVALSREATIAGRRFPEGELVDTGLDVPAGALVPLGMPLVVERGHLRAGITCAACHATVDEASGRIVEGAPNVDLNVGLLMALATNSAAMFRQSDADPGAMPPGTRRYVAHDGGERRLPDPQAMEDAADAAFLAWPPGSFDSTGDLVNNPSQIPSSWTFGAWPYGWSGFATVGPFHGLTTLNNNVHATNSDPTTGADGSQTLLGIDKETYLGVILQAAADAGYRLPDGARPSEFFTEVDPTPGAPGMNRTVAMPGYPLGSIFMLDGLMANTPGLRVGAELDAMSAYQNRLAPPRASVDDADAVARGARVFERAGCAGCHAGRWFTNNRVVPATQVGTQPSRARALAAFPALFTEPLTYPPTVPVPLPEAPPVVPVPRDVSPLEDQALAYATSDPAGGYKVPSLVGVAWTPPYLHDGGVAAAGDALARRGDLVTVARPDRLGIPGTLARGVRPDAAASLRALLDRGLRAAVVAANAADPRCVKANTDGRGHAFWVDREHGFPRHDQDDLIAFLLAIDDEPPGAAAATVTGAARDRR